MISAFFLCKKIKVFYILHYSVTKSFVITILSVLFTISIDPYSGSFSENIDLSLSNMLTSI